ncbi:MAG: sulfite exporter TauE/SafE family protein [Oscillospiraceae bacterium]|nr:sulfite exporter TauE/SafE family protein [Oscillospiraceae bacterium]
MFTAFLPGLINGLLGTGGGILAVSLLKKQGAAPQEAHATAVALMLPLSLISLSIFIFREGSDFWTYWPFLFPAIAGSVLGSRLLRRISAQKLRLLFALLILYSSWRILCS